MIHSIYCNFDT